MVLKIKTELGDNRDKERGFMSATIAMDYIQRHVVLVTETERQSTDQLDP